MDGDIPFDAPRPRLCHLKKRPDFTGYGFNLHAEKGKSGQFIGQVDEGSPAHLAGLREGDRIIEVNGTNVSSENHQQVVQRIKAVPDETKFLVVDKVADEYYHDKKIVIRGDMSNIQYLETPLFQAAGANGIDLKHKPRLCHMKIWSDFAGYGFNLHAEKGKNVQYIGKVDPNSPAEEACLREHDRIVEVNGFNVSAESHQDVVKRIKSDPKQVTLLVVDQDADAYFQKEGIIPSSHMPSVEKFVCPDTKPNYNLDKSEVLYKPRLCRVEAKGDGKGFGFNMQAEKGKPGQYIGKVDPGSPAEEAGLRDGDRLVEVNGFNVEKESHKEVVTRIKSIPNETTLLVIEKEGYNYYTAKGIVVTHALLSAQSSSESGHKSAENGKSGQRDNDNESASSHQDADDREDDHHALAAAAAVAAATAEYGSDDEKSEEELRGDLKSDDHVGVAVHGNEVTLEKVEREENGAEVDKAVILEAKAEGVVKSMAVEKKLENHKEHQDYEDVADEITNVVKNAEKEEAAKHEEKKPDKAALSLKVTSVSASVSSSTSSSTPTPLESPKSPVVIGGIEFAGTAEEARKKMSKKQNVKGNSMSLKAKYDLFQKL